MGSADPHGSPRLAALRKMGYSRAAMVFRLPRVTPHSLVSEERTGRVVGRFCLACGNVYPQYSARHKGKPSYGEDHVAAPCSHEGQRFDAGESWWEPAVEVFPELEDPAD